MNLIKYLFFFLLFFLLFYLENLQVAGTISFSQLWKIPFSFFMIWYVLRESILFMPKFNKYAYFHGLKNLFNPSTFTHPVSNIIEIFRYTNFPLLYNTVDIYFKDSAKLQKFIVRISQYFILTNIPYLLGILQSTRVGMEFGSELSFIGIFQNSHSASIITTLAILVVMFHLKKDELSFVSKIYNSILVILGIYCLYIIFVRTGYLMFIIGCIILFIPAKIGIKQIILFFTIVISIGTSFYYLMETNDSFKQRILDQNKLGEQRNLGSGRLLFATYSIQYWASGNFAQILVGRGLDNVKDNLNEKTGQRIFSHNGFVDALAANGIIGISFFLLFLYYLYKNIRKNSKSFSYRLAMAMFFCFITFQVTQGGAGFPLDLYMVSIVNLVNKQQF